jgi:hypothetical protein
MSMIATRNEPASDGGKVGSSRVASHRPADPIQPATSPSASMPERTMRHTPTGN